MRDILGRPSIHRGEPSSHRQPPYPRCGDARDWQVPSLRIAAFTAAITVRVGTAFRVLYLIGTANRITATRPRHPASTAPISPPG